MIARHRSIMTVIMPVYNRGNLLSKSVESVLNQSFLDFELLLIDDCSTDNTWEIINSYKDPRVKVFKLPFNSGAAAARNLGITKSSGNFVSFLDSDDTFEENFLKISLETLQKTANNVGFMWTGRNIINKKGAHQQTWKPTGTSSYLVFLKDIRIGTGAGITLKREVFDKCGKFNEDLPAAEDTEFFFRISQHFDFTYTEECLINIYRNSSDRLSRSYIRIARAYNIFLKDHYQEIDKDPQLKRIYYYKMMWLNFHIPDPQQAREFFKKIPGENFWDKIKITLIYGMYKFFPLKYASYLHGKLAS